jgi:hypothetical protein
MAPARMGAARPTRYNFTRALLRSAFRQGWLADRVATDFEVAVAAHLEALLERVSNSPCVALDGPHWPELVWLNRFPQAAYRPRDVAKQREPVRTVDQLERQATARFGAFAQVSGLACIDLGDRRSGVQISPARQINRSYLRLSWW